MTTTSRQTSDLLPNGRVRPPGLDDTVIDAVVDDFYAKVRRDPLLGPVFNGAIAEDRWPEHLQIIADFWSSLLLGSGRYTRRPLPPHLELPITDAHFSRWLDLFRETVERLCHPDTAALFVDRAERAGHSFRLGIAFHRGDDTVAMEPIRARPPAS